MKKALHKFYKHYHGNNKNEIKAIEKDIAIEIDLLK